ncbi:MAG TPA: hypothetical protein VNN80_01600, partial [Polyangiaceae bacterium]|nr:hypothetical protein [Polyangiaceae bacterium]
MLELCSFVAALALAAGALRRLGFGPRRAALSLAGMAALLGLGTRLGAPRQVPQPPPIELVAEAGYASSSACRSCHPAQYRTFHDSFHRSMTEVASAESVRAPWQG